MNLRDFIKERIVFIIINSLILLFTALLLMVLKVDSFAILFIVIINEAGILIYHIFDYLRKKQYYNEIKENMESLDKKYLISEVIEEGTFTESKLIYDVICKGNKAMNDEIGEFKRGINDYREYIELWVHEIKTPIATCKLLIENNESPLTESIGEEVCKLENYIDQALFYTRSNTLEKDYIIKEMSLSSCVNKVLNNNADSLIKKRVKISLGDLEKQVYSDSKWIEFILGQIISNSIKYMNKEHKELKIYCNENSKYVILNIEDNGAGISEKDISRVFDKGFTGENGRKFGKSTGIGLYLCKKLCKKLGLDIKLISEEGKFTRVSIIFPINRMMIFE
ncbi:sensor histidine kinase [Clostridium perfringens]|uniref:histidine kinase n=1 Tax=Clostridium perfringens (strain ATCC 13124 / DSM 756 / JCM 1290 / NCIMB 6125 / NCTC 8237 / Type A) TaxID=195103 RepID=A0A0H2YUG0_CLOP1|nr:sensor histidine kinase [Clostridium perfringens]ABG84699.1 sensor histidine kinase [Clostridium perfringens ATCC 13124]MBI6007457.1 sensor histidine kinase [Clostridium perfringens]MDK0530347.1 sensor histidine kinase [Clostridium perfringens]MDK0748494.1 sensor histidine kinase [Clostridium perfringens]MDK0893872.1 sensor histidine kinase [Clostridium perfringens]